MNAVYAEFFPGSKPARVCYEVAALLKAAGSDFFSFARSSRACGAKVRVYI